MKRRSDDSASVYSRPSYHHRSSTIASTVASPTSADVVLGSKSIDARRLSPLSTSYGSSGAWALHCDVASTDSAAHKKQLRISRSIGSTLVASPSESKTGKDDGELLGELFSSVNSNLHVSFPGSPLEEEKQQHQPRLQQSQSLAPSRPPRVHKFSFSRNLMPFQEEEGITSTPPRKLRADLQSKFSMSPDTRSASARSAKAIKKKASQGRVRKTSIVKDQGQASQAGSDTTKPRLKPQSSIHGLKKLVGLTPTGRPSKTSTVPQYEDFPASLRVVLESQALKQAGTVDEFRTAKTSRAEFASVRRHLDHDVTVDSTKDSVGLPQPPSANTTDSFWRKIRASTRPKDSMEGSRNTSRCESRATRRTCEESDDAVNGKQSRWWSRLRDNAAKMVGQSVVSSKPPTVHLQRPSMTVDEDQGGYKGSLDAAMALADGLRGYAADSMTTDCDTGQSMPDPMQHIGGSRRKKRPPVPLLLLQARKEEESSANGQRPYTAYPKLLPPPATAHLRGPLSAPLASHAAKERGGSKKTWLRPLQLTAVLRNGNGERSNVNSPPLPPPKATAELRQASKQSDPCLITRTAVMERDSPARPRLSVPVLSSIQYRDTLPIPPRGRKSRASTVSSMDSRTSVYAVKEDQTQRTEYTQKTVSSSILFKDEELMTASDRLPPRESLPGLPLPLPRRDRSSSSASQCAKQTVTPRQATDILYNLVLGFKNDNSPSTFRTSSQIVPGSCTHLTPLQSTPDAFRQRRGRRTTCTTLESILSYQSSTDGSSSFQSRAISSSAGDTSGQSQSKHLQSLIDGVLEDIEDLLCQSASSSRLSTVSPSTDKQSSISRGTRRRLRSISMSSAGSAHSKFQWPLKTSDSLYQQPQLRLLGAKLFPSTLEISLQDSPCPPSKKRPATAEKDLVDTETESHQVSRTLLTEGLHGFQTDLRVGQACIPPMPKFAFRNMMQKPPYRDHPSNQRKAPERSTFVLNSMSPSIMQPSVKAASPLPPTIRVQRPLSEASVSSATFESQDVAVIQCAKVVQNRTSSASLMDLNGIMNQVNKRRSRSPSCSSPLPSAHPQPTASKVTYGSPETPLSPASSSQPWSDSSLSRMWESTEKRHSYSTSYTDVSPTSGVDYKSKQQTFTSPLQILHDKDQNGPQTKDNLASCQEALEAIQYSRQCHEDSEYARQILSSELKDSVHTTKDAGRSGRILGGISRVILPTQREDPHSDHDRRRREAKGSKEDKEEITTQSQPDPRKRSHPRQR